jgi:AcrR family transcriptional regulator
MPAAGSPSRQGRAYRSEEIEQLLRAALAELMADGAAFRDISVERLITSAGMARSTFYVHFDDKFAMLAALSATTLKRLYTAQRTWMGKDRDVTAADVRDSMRRLFDAFADDEAVMRAVAEAAVYDPKIREAYVSSVQDYAGALERYIRRGQKGGWVTDLAPSPTGQVLAWMTERTVTQVAAGMSARRLDALADSLARVICSTLFR